MIDAFLLMTSFKGLILAVILLVSFIESDILKYVDSMPERIDAVTAAEGGHTQW